MPTYMSPGIYVEEVPATTQYGSADRSTQDAGGGVGRRTNRVTRSRWLAAETRLAILGFAAQGPVGVPMLVVNWDSFRYLFGDPLPGGYLAPAVLGFFENGGSQCYVVRLAGKDVPSDEAVSASVVLPGAQQDAAGSLRVSARQPGSDGNRLTVEALPFSDDEADRWRFSLQVRRDGQVVEYLQGMQLDDGPRGAPRYAAEVSSFIDIDLIERNVFPVTGREFALQGGLIDPSGLSADDLVGDYETPSGLAALERIWDIDLVCAPDWMGAYAAGRLDIDSVLAAQQSLISHCELMGDRIALLDCPPDLTPGQVLEWRTDRARWDSSCAALYYPWIWVADPSQAGMLSIPPSGHVGGVYARSALTKGIHRTVANEHVVGAIGTERAVTYHEMNLLNPNGINVINIGGGHPPTIYGGRTLSSDPAWRLVGARRTADFFARNVVSGMRWVLYEHHDEDLYARIADELSSLCDLLLCAGVLVGDAPEDAYSVRCDAQLNPVSERGSGFIYAECDLNLDQSQQSFRLVFASV